MRNILVILLTLVTLSVTAQPHSEWRKARKTKWQKTAICVGTSLASVALEMTGDALYDMGKESGNINQMRWGHTLQATGYVVPLVSIPFLVKDSNNKVIADVAIIVSTYALTRFATADLSYNLTRGLDPLYAGVITEHDNIMSKVPPDGRVVYKTLSFTFGFVLNLNHW